MVLSSSGLGQSVLSRLTTVRICIELLRLVSRFLVRAAGFSELLVKLNQSRLKTAMCIAMDIATMAPSNNWFSSPAFQVGNSGSSPDGATKE